METMENINKLLLQNVLPFHVASFFMGKAIRNQVTPKKKDIKQNTLSVWDFLSQAAGPGCHACFITFLLCVSGPVQSVIWLCVCDVCLRATIQGVLQWEQRQQRRPGVFALPQRDHIWLWWGMRKNLLLCTVSTALRAFSLSSSPVCHRSFCPSQNSPQWRRLKQLAALTWLLQGWRTHQLEMKTRYLQSDRHTHIHVSLKKRTFSKPLCCPL